MSAIIPDEMIKEKLDVVGIENAVTVGDVNNVLKELDLKLLQSDILHLAIIKALGDR